MQGFYNLCQLLFWKIQLPLGVELAWYQSSVTRRYCCSRRVGKSVYQTISGYAKARDQIDLGKAEDFVKINKTEDTGEYRQS
jgi:hypothetical protein